MVQSYIDSSHHVNRAYNPHTVEVFTGHDEKATLSEKDKKLISELLANDGDLQIVEALISNLSEAWVRWDARRSRLNRDFEVALIEHEFRRRLSAADYEAHRRRNSS